MSTRSDGEPGPRQLLEQLAREMPRRQFIARAAAAGISATALSGLLDACGSGGGGSAKRGGSVVVSTAQSPSTLDPAFGINAGEFTLTSWLYDNLVMLTPELQLKPMLATDWKASSDATSFTFNLRKGVKFTTGRELTADDVVFSITRILDHKTGSPGRTALGPVSRVEATGTHTVRFTLSSPYVDLPYALTDRWGRIVPRDKGDSLKAQAFGSGPFKLKEYLPGDHVTVVRNPDHWESGVPVLNELTLRTYPDAVAEITALQNNDAQVMYTVAPNSFDRVAAIAGVKIYQVPTGNWLPMVMRVDMPPFDKNEVRLAIKYCMNRGAFVKTVLRGHGTPANDHNIPPNSPYYLDAPVRKQDYAKAKQLLAQAGLASGFTHDLIAATDTPLRADTAVAIQQMVKPAGITFNVKTIDYSTYIAQVYKKAPLYIGNWAMRPALDAQLTPFFGSTGSFNEYRYKNPELDRLLADARSTLDQAKRKDYYHKVQKVLSDDGPALIPYLVSYVTAASKKLVNFKAHPLGWMDLRHVSLTG